MSIKKSLLIQDIPVSYLEGDLVIYLENHLSRSNKIVMALPRNMISLHQSHLVVAFIDRTPPPPLYRRGFYEKYVLLFIYPFGFILLTVLPFYWGDIPPRLL